MASLEERLQKIGKEKSLQERLASIPSQSLQDRVNAIQEKGTLEQVGEGMVEGVRQIAGGVSDALTSAAGLFEPAARKMEEVLPLGSVEFDVRPIMEGKLPKVGLTEEFVPLQGPKIAEPKTAVSGAVRGITQFLVPFLPAEKALRAAQIGQKVAGTLGGGRIAEILGTFTEAEIAAQIAEQTAFDPHSNRLSNLVEEFPALKNPVTNFLKADPKDSEAESRFKMALEGLGLGVIATPFVEAVKGIRRARIPSEEAPARAAVEAEKIVEPAAKEPKTATEYAGNINLDRIDSEEAAKDVIRETSEQFSDRMELARRGRISDVETAHLADTLGMSVDDLMQRRKGEAFNAETALAARNLLVASSERVVQLAKAARGGSDEALVALEQARLQHMAIQEQVAGMTAEAGRALRSFQIMASAENRTRALKELIDARGGRQKIEEFADLAAELDTPEQVAEFIRKSQKATKTEKLIEVWINALLSGPQTHAVNMLSNTLVSMWTIPEHFLAAGIGAFRKGNKVTFRDSVSRSYGWVEGWRDGIKMMGKTLKTGEPSDVFSKIETPREAAIGGRVGEAVRLPGRFLAAEDELFKTIGYRMELRSRAMRDGLEKGLEGEALSKHVIDILHNPPENLKLAAIDAARYQTFTKPLIPGGIASGLQRFKSRHPSLSIIFPFVRTPTNIIRFAGERSVFAPLFKEFKDAMRAGGAERDVAISRMVMGSGVSATIAHLAAEGHITGGGPTDPRARAAKLDTGWQPYSIKIGDEYYAYNRLEPLGMLFGVAADFSEISGNLEGKEADEIAAAIAFSVSKNLTSKTWLSGIADLIEAVEDPERFGPRYVQRLAGTLVPTGVAQVTRVQDPVLRDVRGDPASEEALKALQPIINTLKSRIPGYSETLPARRNIWGEPIVLDGGLGPDIVSPIYTSTDKKDPVRDEVVRLELNLAMPQRDINGVELSPEQYWEYVELAGRPAKETLDTLVSSEGWDRIPDRMKESTIRRIISSHRDMARSIMMAKYSDRLLVGPAMKRAEELRIIIRPSERTGTESLGD